MNWEAEHYNSVLEITVSFLGIFKWEQDIYIGFHQPFICSVGTTRGSSPHFLDWAAFAEMTLPSLGLPFLLCWFSKRP
jgi:hypothetical protein